MTQTVTTTHDANIGLAPILRGRRIEAMDILRGLALFGIFAVNVQGFAAPFWISGYEAPPYGLLDRLAGGIIEFVFSSKIFTLFSFLFGLGFALQLGRTEEAGGRIMSFYPRRLIVLLVLGLAHHVLLWDGDILALYAALGFILLLYRKASDRVLLVSFFVTLVLGWGMDMFTANYDAIMGLDIDMEYLEYVRKIFGASPYRDVVAFRAGELSESLYYLVVWQGLQSLAMFFAGMFVGRRKWIERLDELRWLPRLVLCSGLAGLALSIPTALLHGTLAQLILRPLANTAMTLFYASGVFLLCVSARTRKLLSPVAAAGRMALSNYIGQSLIASIVFQGYGFALYEKQGPASWLLFVALVYTFQLLFSSLWLSRFNFGPLEWLWRWLTYGKAPPLLRRRAI